jgi:alkanesulfonate monooxygenase
VGEREVRLPVKLFCTVPQSSDHAEGAAFLDRVVTVSRWCEEAGFEGILIYTSNRFVDPWMVAQVMLGATERLCPFVAVQPIFMHPYTVAKKVASLGFVYGRRLYLNLVAGGFKNELTALGDDTPHDERYDRLTEYAQVIQGLLAAEAPLTFHGRYYRIDGVTMQPPLATALTPGICLSGSSDAGMAAARTLGATAIEVPRAGDEYTTPRELRAEAGIRIGIVAHEDDAEAWEIARRRFPDDRKGQLVQKLANKASDGVWYNQLSGDEAADRLAGPGRSPYWLGPFRNFQSFVPYLVGSHARVSDELAKYVRAGFGLYVIDMPAEEPDVVNAGIVFRMAVEKAQREAE